MPEVALRFAVFCPDGRSTDIWKIWANRGSGRRDVYVTSRPLGGSAKLSLHSSGQWHIAFHREKMNGLFEPESAPDSRFIARGETPERVVGLPLRLAATVFFSWGSPTIDRNDLPEDLVRIDAAPRGMAVQVNVFLCDIDERPDTWPGRKSMGTNLLGRIPLDGGGGVSVVYKNVGMPNISPRQNHGSPHYFAGKSRRDLEVANRLLAWGRYDDGSIWFMETPLKVEAPTTERDSRRATPESW